MSIKQDLELRLLNAAELQIAAKLLSTAMLDNPLHIKVFGRNKRQKHLYSFFNILLPLIYKRGFLYGYFDKENLVAVFGAMQPSNCNLPLISKLNLVVAIFKKFNFIISIKTCYWLFNWHLHDPKTPHWHLGPLAVAASHRQQGIANLLMKSVISMSEKAPLWLETDKQLNVDIYTKLGFVVVKKITILGDENWLMVRE